MKKVVDKLTKDKQGNQTIFQKPNLPLLVWLVALILTKILPYGQLNSAANLISFGALFTWAWLELFEGDSPLRRILGGVLLVFIIMNRL